MNTSSPIALPEWSYTLQKPINTGLIKQQAADFKVNETLVFEPSGKGEHAYLLLQKTSENTEFTARKLARIAQVRQRDIGYAGLKDRHAICKQWFSVWLPGKTDPDWQQLENENIQLLHVDRHDRKLKRGAISNNHFQIIIRQCTGDKDILNDKLNLISQHGFANYFGQQRFGHQAGNIERAKELFAGKRVKPAQKSIYLSSVRAFLFNTLLDQRIRLNCWDQALEGDCLMLNQNRSFFHCPQIDSEIENRLTQQQLHVCGFLYGKGERKTTSEALQLENQILNSYPELAHGLIKQNLDIDRRSFRAIATGLNWKWLTHDSLLLDFSLVSGSYATALLRELFHEPTL